MSDRPLSKTNDRQNGHAGPAVLLLDNGGRILSANTSARALWQAGVSELVGEAFAGLFAFEVTSILIIAAMVGAVVLARKREE